MPFFGHFDYMMFSDRALLDFIKYDVSKQAQRLFIFYGLNWNSYTKSTEPHTDNEIADKLNCHRTTVIRARAELEKKGLILPTKETQRETHSYQLPAMNKVEAEAQEKKEKNAKRKREQEFAKRRANIEADLGRRLTHLEIKRLKQRFDL